jgi:hypothetical protein
MQEDGGSSFIEFVPTTDPLGANSAGPGFGYNVPPTADGFWTLTAFVEKSTPFGDWGMLTRVRFDIANSVFGFTDHGATPPHEFDPDELRHSWLFSAAEAGLTHPISLLTLGVQTLFIDPEPWPL